MFRRSKLDALLHSIWYLISRSRRYVRCASTEYTWALSRFWYIWTLAGWIINKTHSCSLTHTHTQSRISSYQIDNNNNSDKSFRGQHHSNRFLSSFFFQFPLRVSFVHNTACAHTESDQRFQCILLILNIHKFFLILNLKIFRRLFVHASHLWACVCANELNFLSFNLIFFFRVEKVWKKIVLNVCDKLFRRKIKMPLANSGDPWRAPINTNNSGTGISSGSGGGSSASSSINVVGNAVSRMYFSFLFCSFCVCVIYSLFLYKSDDNRARHRT